MLYSSMASKTARGCGTHSSMLFSSMDSKTPRGCGRSQACFCGVPDATTTSRGIRKSMPPGDATRRWSLLLGRDRLVLDAAAAGLDAEDAEDLVFEAGGGGE